MQSSNDDYDTLLDYKNTLFHEDYHFVDTLGHLDEVSNCKTKIHAHIFVHVDHFLLSISRCIGSWKL